MKQLKILVLSKSADNLINAIKHTLPSCDHFMFSTKGEIDFFDIVLVQYDYIKKNFSPDQYPMFRDRKIALLANFTDNILLNEILESFTPYHLIGLSDLNAISDIKDFILSFENKKFWKANELIQMPYRSKHLQVTDSSGYQIAIQNMIDEIDFTHCFDGFKAYLNQIMNEILTNSLYNAPTNEKGEYIYRAKSRTEKISMIPGKEVDIHSYENDNKIVFSIIDKYGSLSKQDIDKHINNNKVLDKDGGAGVGIYTAFRFCHKIIFNVAHQESTEVIVILNKLKRNKQYSLIDKSFHFFEN